MSRFLLLRPSFTKKQTLKKFMDFFSTIQKYAPSVINALYYNLGLCDYVLFLQIQSLFLKKLSSAFSLLPSEEWDDMPGTTNLVESINCQSIRQNTKSVSLNLLDTSTWKTRGRRLHGYTCIRKCSTPWITRKFLKHF